MASLDISHEIGRSYQALVSSPPPNKPSPTYAQWAVFSVSTPLANAFVAASATKASVLKVHSTAEGELQDLIDEFNDGKVQFAFVKVKDANTGLAKFVLVAWCGEGVPERVKGHFTGHLNAVSKVLHGYHVQITARSESDLSPESIIQKVADASGSKYSAASAPTGPGPRPVVSASKPAYQPTRVSGGTFTPASSRSPYKRDEQTDADGWGADAPPVTRSQLEKVTSAYKPTKVDIAALRAQPTSTTSGPNPSGNPDVVKGAYQPIGKVDIAALRAGRKHDAPEIVKGSYEPVGKVDIAAIRAQAQPRPAARSAPPAEEREERTKPLSGSSSAFSQSERLTSLPKPRSTKKFGAGAPVFGTKPPTPGAFGIAPNVPATPPVGAASRDFGSSGGKTPAQLWAEKKAKGQGTSGASDTTAPGYTGQQYPPVSTSTTGHSAGSNEGISNRYAQKKAVDPQVQEDVQSPAGGISALRNKFASGPPMGVPTSPRSPQRTGGFHSNNYDDPPPVDSSSRPPPAPPIAVLPPPPPVQPRSPTPPSPEIPGSPVRIVMPVGREQETPLVARHDPEPAISMPAESLGRIIPSERDLPEEEPARERGAAVGISAGGDDLRGEVGKRRALILYDYDAAEENEISLVEGQVVGEIDMVDEVFRSKQNPMLIEGANKNKDWWAGRNSAGQHGLFPSNYVDLLDEDEAEVEAPRRPAIESPAPADDEAQDEPQEHPSEAPGKEAVALYEYDAAEENEISFPEEAIIEDIEFPDDDWWLGTYKGNRGLFPANYVELRS